MKTQFNTIIILIVFTIVLINTNENSSQTQYQKVFHNVNPSYILAINKTTSGGYIIGGYTDLNFYILNLDINGNIIWSRTAGGTNGAEYVYSVIQTDDGGFAAGGYTNSFGSGHDDFYIIRFDSNGNLLWHKTIGGANYDFCFSMTKTSDGGFIMSGKSDSYNNNADIMIIKLHSNGSIQWSKTIGLTISDEARSIIQTRDGGYAIAGNILSGPGNNYDCYIAKLDSLGNIQWNRTIGNNGNTNEDYSYSIIQTADDGFAIAGVTNSYGAGGYDFYAIKLDINGLLQWSRTIGGPNNEKAYSIFQTIDSGYVMAGYTQSFGADFEDTYIVKLDKNGQLQWNKMFGSTFIDEFRGVVQNSDGSYVAAGFTFTLGEGGGLITKFDNFGNSCGFITVPQSTTSTGGILTYPIPIINTVSPVINSPSGIIGTSGITNTLCLTPIQSTGQELTSFSLSQNYPNPFNPTTHFGFRIADFGMVRLSVFDVLGKEVQVLVNQELKPGSYEADWDASAYPSGVYYYKLESGSFTETKKMVLIK